MAGNLVRMWPSKLKQTRKVDRAAETLAKRVRWCTVLTLEDAEFKSKEFAERLIEVSVPKTVWFSEGS